jgi:glycosyltransferase involved in cell wall biosynthesis
MNKYPKITIVTPTFNRSDYLEETILSVIRQGYPELEYIIIDGGSTDGTVEIIKKYEPYLSYWISEPDKGMYYALQKGFDKSTGDIMAWINSDDIYNAKSLFAVAQIFSDLPDLEWIVGMPTMYNSNGICVKVSEGRRWAESRLYAGDYRWIQQESVFWRRILWDRVGNYLNTSLKYAGDFDLWCRFFKETSLFTVSTSFGGFRSHGNQLSLQFSAEYEAEASNIAKAIIPQPGDLGRFNMIRRLWKFRNLNSRKNSSIAKYISIILTWIVDKMHRYPPQVYYVITENKWKK